MQTKKEIRQQILKQRNDMDFEQVQMLSEEICSKIKELSVYKTAENVCRLGNGGFVASVRTVAHNNIMAGTGREQLASFRDGQNHPKSRPESARVKADVAELSAGA